MKKQAMHSIDDRLSNLCGSNGDSDSDGDYRQLLALDHACRPLPWPEFPYLSVRGHKSPTTGWDNQFAADEK